MTTKTAAQKLEELKKRHAALLERRAGAAALLDSKQAEFAEACREAKEAFGTDDLDALRRMYQELTAENDIKVIEFEETISAAEQQLADVERQLAV